MEIIHVSKFQPGTVEKKSSTIGPQVGTKPVCLCTSPSYGGRLDDLHSSLRQSNEVKKIIIDLLHYLQLILLQPVLVQVYGVFPGHFCKSEMVNKTSVLGKLKTIGAGALNSHQVYVMTHKCKNNKYMLKH